MREFRYMFIAGTSFDDSGKWDPVAQCRTLEEAVDFSRARFCKGALLMDWWQVVDLETLTVVEEGEWK